MTDAIMLAGGGDASTPNKAFLDGAGHPMVWYVARALAGARSVGRVVAVGPPDRLQAACGGLVERIVPDGGGSILDNAVSGLSALTPDPGRSIPDPSVLVAASDIPLLTSEAVEDFLAACSKEAADLHYPIVPQSALDDRYPGARKTFIRVVDGSFTGGSLFLFKPRVVDRVRDFAEKVLRARKKPWLMAQLFGWSTVMRFSSGRLSINDVETRAREITGLDAKAMIIRRPELALDADEEHPENLEIIRRALRGEGAH
ncbi:MAG TPA: nucleotidyltransferase family protein [bacterium]|jgi:GTP:adenosylcobinamide-phosphate guanylyltransferase|nr:nucleotidyltransferase family protein [bacterium]